VQYLLSSKASEGFEFLEQTGSTNKDLLARSNELPEFYVLATDFQSAGRGRMERTWVANPGSSVMASVLLRPGVAGQGFISWIPLITALAIRNTLKSQGLEAKVKWPNDVLIENKKVSGILSEASQDLAVVVVGFGLNVSQSESDLPVETATSLALAGSKSLDRDLLLSEIITELRNIYGQLASGGDVSSSGLRESMIEASATIGQKVRVEFPDGSNLIGEAIDLDQQGRLLVKTATATHTVSAGDVLHLRTA
jgi:BirA family transcriptional regulator, biotin operon repressor / biotin---[acetyl-CoA-carboxylase] ligase